MTNFMTKMQLRNLFLRSRQCSGHHKNDTHETPETLDTQRKNLQSILFPFIGTQTVTPVEREWREPLPLFLRYAGNGMTSLSGGRIFGCCSSGCMALSTVPMSR